MDFERLECVLVEGRDEDDGREVLGFDPGQDFEAVHARHLDIEKEQVGALAPDEAEGFGAVLTLADDLHLRVGGEQFSNRLPRQRLVVDDQRPDFLRPRAHRPEVAP